MSVSKETNNIIRIKENLINLKNSILRLDAEILQHTITVHEINLEFNPPLF